MGVTSIKKFYWINMASPSPLSICLTNMVIVFAVLIFLAFVIQLIHVIDPTKAKKKYLNHTRHIRAQNQMRHPIGVKYG